MSQQHTTGELSATGFIRQSQRIPAIEPFSFARLGRKVRAGTLPASVKLPERVTVWSVERARAQMVQLGEPMKVIDTNVFSEPFKSPCSQRVIDWLDRQPAESLYLCAMTLAEVDSGIAKMPHGRRREYLQEGVQLLLGRFAGRILPFDEQAACKYAEIQEALKAQGEAISVQDCLIASVAAARGFAVATRDVRPFQAAGLEVINPWE